MYVIDASVHVADARPDEPHHGQARALMDQLAAEGHTVYLPVIVLAEVAAAISRGTGRCQLARRLVAVMQRVPHFEFVPVDDGLGQLAAEFAADYLIRGCDAVYVALAEQRNARLVTLDRQQRDLDRQQRDRVPPSLVVCTPAEELAERGAVSR